MADRIKVACLQISAGREVDPNLQAIGDMARRAGRHHLDDGG